MQAQEPLAASRSFFIAAAASDGIHFCPPPPDPDPDITKEEEEEEEEVSSAALVRKEV